MSAPRNGLASASVEVPDLRLHQRRHGAGYDSHTPDYRASSETVRQEDAAAGDGPSNGNGSGPFLGAAIRVQPAPDAGRRRTSSQSQSRSRSSSSDSQGGSPSASSTSSDEDEGLLPSFGGPDDADPILARHKDASPLLFQKSTPKQEGYNTPSASTTSLGLNTHAQNGFTSRDDLAQAGSTHSDGRDGQLSAEKRGKKGNRKAVKGKGKGKGKRPSWKERERQRTRAFAREMAFVVRVLHYRDPRSSGHRQTALTRVPSPASSDRPEHPAINGGIRSRRRGAR